MIPRHHPPDAQWPAYVAGSLDQARRLLLEAHLTHCDACAREAARLAEPGGTLLRELRPEPPPADLFERLLVRLSDAPMTNRDPIPAFLRPHLPPEGERAWQGVLKSGVRLLEIAAGESRRVRLYLVHIAAGRAFPHHAHGGLEEAVILAGGAVDGGIRLEPGDWRSYPEGSVHQPAAFPDEDCWILARIEEEVRLSGWRGVLQRL